MRYKSKSKKHVSVVLLGIGLVLSATVDAAGKDKGVRNTEAVLDIVVNDQCAVTITSSKGISNLVIQDADGSTHKTEFDSEIRTYSLSGVWADYEASMIFVKSGNNGSKGVGALLPNPQSIPAVCEVGVCDLGDRDNIADGVADLSVFLPDNNYVSGPRTGWVENVLTPAGDNGTCVIDVVDPSGNSTIFNLYRSTYLDGFELLGSNTPEACAAELGCSELLTDDQ